MHRYTAFSTIVLLISAVIVGCEPAREPAAPEAVAPAVNEPPAWEDELHEMVQTLDLTIAEEDALRAAFEQRDAEVRAFMESERGRQLSEDEAALADAARARDLSTVKSITDRAGDDRGALRQIIDEGNQRIRETLPEEKREAWDAHVIASELLALMEPLQLDAEQEADIRAHALTAVEAAIGRNEPNVKAAAFLSLEEIAESAVLTPLQREAYADIKDANPLRSLRL